MRVPPLHQTDHELQSAPSGVTSGYVGSLGFYIDGVERLAASHEQPITLPTTEAHIGTHLWQQNLPNTVTIWSKNVHAVKTLTTPAGGGPQVAVSVDAHAIGHARQAVEDHQGKPAPMLQPLTIDDVPDRNFTGVIGVVGHPGVDDVEFYIV